MLQDHVFWLLRSWLVLFEWLSILDCDSNCFLRHSFFTQFTHTNKNRAIFSGIIEKIKSYRSSKNPYILYMYIYNLFHVIHWPYRVIFTNLQKGNVVICFIYISMFLVQQHLNHIMSFSSWRDPKPKALLRYSAGHHRMGSVFLVVYNRKGKVSFSHIFYIVKKICTQVWCNFVPICNNGS